MARKRMIAASPVRPAQNAWDLVVNLLTDTLEKSPSVETGSVAKELRHLSGLGPALVAAAHLERDTLILIDEALELHIAVITGEPAFDVSENLNPVPGGGQASGEWMLYVPTPGPLANQVEAAVSQSPNLAAGKPESKATSKADVSSGNVVNLDVLNKWEGSS